MTKKDKKGQVAIFVIIAVVLVASILLFLFIENGSKIQSSFEENPPAYISDCVQRPLEDIELKIISSNGYLNANSTNFIIYEGEKVPYLCKASKFYTSCVNQDPLIIERIRSEIESYTYSKTESCFDSLTLGLENKGYEVSQGVLSTQVEFNQDSIVLNIDKSYNVEKEGTSNFKKFKAEAKSPLFKLFSLAQTIVNFESQYCEFDNILWMRFYRDIKIERFRASEQTKIYTLTDRVSEKSIKFAVKTCVLPAGI